MNKYVVKPQPNVVNIRQATHGDNMNADDELRHVVRAWLKNDRSARKGSEDMKMPRTTFRRKLAKAMERGLHLSEGAQIVVKQTKLAPMEVRGGWLHNYNEEGKKIGATYWKAPESEQEDIAERLIQALGEITIAAPIKAPIYVDDDLLTVYPIADAHIGMMAWGKETGEDYDTSIAVERLRNWICRAVESSPASGHAVILGVGDLTHADDQSNMTPRSKHVLDIDTRHFKTLDATISAMAYCAEYAAVKHERVTIRILPGNHDMNTYMAVMFALSERYRDNPRIHVQKEPGEFWVHQHGKCLLAAHHGHGSKPDRMVMYLADEYAQIWGATKHRVIWTGHLHHAKMADIGGATWEQLRAVTARDAYAVGNAYVARAQLQAITFDKERGEVMRVKISG